MKIPTVYCTNSLVALFSFLLMNAVNELLNGGIRYYNKDIFYYLNIINMKTAVLSLLTILITTCLVA